MRWNLRLAAANRGIWKASELQRMLADHGLSISAGKMSGLWSGTPASIKLSDLGVICAVLNCGPEELCAIHPILLGWADHYHHLREVTPDDITTVTDSLKGSQRRYALSVLRSLFRHSKKTRMVFHDPTARIRPGPQHLQDDRAAAADRHRWSHRCRDDSGRTPHSGSRGCSRSAQPRYP
jgi:DNA-binding Xre family transcriptional regulator